MRAVVAHPDVAAGVTLSIGVARWARTLGPGFWPGGAGIWDERRAGARLRDNFLLSLAGC